MRTSSSGSKTTTFAGFTSRWTMLCSCRWRKAATHCRKMRRLIKLQAARRLSRIFCRSGPSHSSVTSQCLSPS